ncbi:MAG TPA: DUF2934 domain-containing protein, partial [Candidatus Binatia bacterium]|nr:DUF2934 domain-containing protein [Candidatus Binatia bacterium]
MKTNKSTKSQSKKSVATKKKTVVIKRTAGSVKARPAAAISAPRQEITTETIATRAYTLWEKDGRPNGRDAEYWFQAE